MEKAKKKREEGVKGKVTKMEEKEGKERESEGVEREVTKMESVVRRGGNFRNGK